MHVGLITYHTGHRKTLDVTLKLLTKGYRVTWFAFPFVKREPKPDGRRPDRPDQLLDFDPEKFCRDNFIGYRKVDGWGPENANAFLFKGEFDAHFGTDIDKVDVFLHCTAKIIPDHFIAGRIILNVHPGLLPKNRGVDALKWSIVNGWPIGVTLHAIDEEIDRGTILYRRTVPIMPTDRLDDVFLRMYEFECDLLANFDAHLDNLRHDWKVGDHYPVSHKRIPKALDDRLDEIFNEVRETLSGISAQDAIAHAHSRNAA